MVDPITTGVGLVGMAWAAKKVLGPTLDALGEDLKTLYRDRSTRIINRAVNKIDDPEDGKCANLRIVRDVLWNGAYSESEVFTEYYAGVLAASRSKDGLDDGMAPFVDAVKSLSTSQLKLHYDIYCSLERMLNQSYESGLRFNVSSVQTTDVFLPRFGSPVDLQVMLRNGLITEFTIDYEILTSQESERACPYLRTRPTTFGVMLYAAAHNRLEWWEAFGMRGFGELRGVEPPEFYGRTKEELLSQYFANL